MILLRILARILQERSYLASTEKLCKFLEEYSCKEMSDLLNQHFLQENWTNQKTFARIFQESYFSCFFCKIFALSAIFFQFPARIMQYLARSCKILPRILQVLSNILTRQDKDIRVLPVWIWIIKCIRMAIDSFSLQFSSMCSQMPGTKHPLA